MFGSYLIGTLETEPRYGKTMRSVFFSTVAILILGVCKLSRNVLMQRSIKEIG